jgi:Carboxypeptidase regulatory-like domain
MPLLFQLHLRAPRARASAFAVLAAILLGNGVATRANSDRALAGTVIDATGAAVPHASVTVTGGNQNRRTEIDESGRFEFTALGNKTYSLTVESPGFSLMTVKHIRIASGERRMLSLTLKVGSFADPCPSGCKK